MADGLTVKFRKAILTKLKSYISATYYRRAVNAPALYCIFDIDSVTRDEEAVGQWQLAVSIFASGDNTEALDNAADAVWQGLDHWFYSNNSSGLYFNTYQSVRSASTDEDNGNHTRRRLVFTIHLFQ